MLINAYNITNRMNTLIFYLVVKYIFNLLIILWEIALQYMY